MEKNHLDCCLGENRYTPQKESTPQTESMAEETLPSLEDLDENCLSDSEDIPRERLYARDTAGPQMAVGLHLNFDEILHSRLDDDSLNGNVGIVHRLGEFAVYFPVLSQRELLGSQETSRIFRELRMESNSSLEDPGTFEVCDVSYPLESDDVVLPFLRGGKEAQDTALKLEAFESNTALELEDTSQKDKLIETEDDDLEVFEADTYLGLKEYLSEGKEVETTIKCLDDVPGDYYNCALVLEDLRSLSHLDDIETATASNCVWKSVSIENKEVTYSIEIARHLLFEWLSGQEAVTSYYYMNNEITIHVERGCTQTSTIDIPMIIRTQFPQLRHIYTIVYSDPGVCVPCVKPPCLSERGDPVLMENDEKIAYPGRVISCSTGTLGTGATTCKCGTFSGKICGYGITAGHMISSESEMAHSSSICLERQVIGIAILPVRYVRVPIRGTTRTRKTLADLLFFSVSDQRAVINKFYGDPLDTGRKYVFDIVLHKGLIKENDSVMVILRNEDVKFGRIASIDYSNSPVSNALYIVDENNRALTVSGDSGAIVVLRPNHGYHNLKAIGVITHLQRVLKPEFRGTTYTELNDENSISLGSIAIRLYDVLVAIQHLALLGSPPEFRKIDLGQLLEYIEFSGPVSATQQFDSGVIRERRSLEDPESLDIIYQR